MTLKNSLSSNTVTLRVSASPDKAAAPAVVEVNSSMTTAARPVPAHVAPAALRIALTAFALGLVGGVGLMLGYRMLTPSKLLKGLRTGWTLIPRVTGADLGSIEYNVDDLPQLPWEREQLFIYLAAWASFHLLEFVVTAAWNGTRLMEDSFLLQNGIGYHLAHLCGILEFLLEAQFFPHTKTLCRWTYLGLVVLLLGQYLRSLAMVEAGNNFSHTVAWRKREDHELVTSGVYRLSRHPSYVGFFYWALGTQILLMNPISACIFMVVLWRFFSHRIHAEERYLVDFFGDQYIQYRKRVGTKLPFIQ